MCGRCSGCHDQISRSEEVAYRHLGERFGSPLHGLKMEFWLDYRNAQSGIRAMQILQPINNAKLLSGMGVAEPEYQSANDQIFQPCFASASKGHCSGNGTAVWQIRRHVLPSFSSAGFDAKSVSEHDRRRFTAAQA